MAFIVFEGIDGSGKSSLIRALEAELTQRKMGFVTTREPGGTPLGEELRAVLLRNHEPTPSSKTELLLYQAIRAQHVEAVIRPSLLRGQWVLCDRYVASSLAFQCAGRDLEESAVSWLNHYSTGGLWADLTVLLDLPVETGALRIQDRSKKSGIEEDRFEREPSDFHNRVRESYRIQARTNPAKWLLLNAEESTDQLRLQLFTELRKRQWLSS